MCCVVVWDDGDRGGGGGGVGGGGADVYDSDYDGRRNVNMMRIWVYDVLE